MLEWFDNTLEQATADGRSKVIRYNRHTPVKGPYRYDAEIQNDAGVFRLLVTPGKFGVPRAAVFLCSAYEPYYCDATPATTTHVVDRLLTPLRGQQPAKKD